MPPQCFFPSPKPSNLITVPSCSVCNREFGKIDERVRNILASFETTENHDAIRSQIAQKRFRSYSRDKGTINLKHLISSLIDINIYTSSGIYLGKKPAFNLDQPVFDKFLERLVRAFLYYENKIEYFYGQFEWRISFSVEEYQNMPPEMKELFANPSILRILGDNIFHYAGWFINHHIDSIWIFGFYRGIEFLVRVVENTEA